jgi:hypothetical protein
MRVQDLKKLPQRSIVKVSWLDICEDNAGDPRGAYVVMRHTLGHIWGVKRESKAGVHVLTLTFTWDEDGPEQSGWICIPVSCVREVEVIREAEGGSKVSGPSGKVSRAVDKPAAQGGS